MDQFRYNKCIFRGKKSNIVKGIYRVWVSGVGSRKQIAAYMADFGAKNGDIGLKHLFSGHPIVALSRKKLNLQKSVGYNSSKLLSKPLH